MPSYFGLSQQENILRSNLTEIYETELNLT